MRKNIYGIFYVLLLLFALIPSVRAADNVPSGVIQVGNRAYEDATLSFDAELSGDSLRGQLAVAVFTESGQFRNCSFYPAASAVSVRLRDVGGADFVKAVWLDDDFCPLAEPALLRMPDNGAVAYANFADDLRNLMEHSAGAGAEAFDPENPYALARLIVRCDALPDLSRFPVTGRAQGPDGLYVLQFQNDAWAEQCAAYLRTCSSVRYVEPDAVIQIQEPDAANLSAYEEGAESAYLSWGAETTGIGKYAEYLAQNDNRDGVTVAVVDSGVDLGHPFLTRRLLPGRDILRGNSEPQDEFGHGTHVAGIIVDCTQNLNVKILPVRTLDAAGGCGSLALIASAIRWAADNGANVINLSLSTPASACVDEAVQYALDKNITVVTAAGNQYVDTDKRSPARVTDAITVAAVNAADGRFPYSNYGDAVDLSAPGEGIFSAYLRGQGDNGGDYRTLSGTSMAAPHVAAAAALLLCERGVSQTPAQISAALRDAALDVGASGWDRYYGTGTLNMLPFVPRPEPLFYALLYADGELVFQSTQTPDDGRTVLYTYPLRPESHGHAEYAAWYEQRNNIKKVTFSETVQPDSTALWFYDCANLTEISGLERLDTSGVTNMSQMFSMCENLTELDLTAFDTATVTDMSQMFFGCAKLNTIYASGKFMADAVMSDADMFDGCATLVGGTGTKYDDARTGKDYARIDGGAESPGYFTDGNVYAILYSDGTLTFQHDDTPESGKTVKKTYEVDLNAVYTYSNYKPSTPWYDERESVHVVNFADKINPGATAYWFCDCWKLERIDNIQNLNTANVTDMSFMFDSCGLTALDLSHFDTANVTSMYAMFDCCSELTVLDLSHFDTANVTDMRAMFSYCYSLKTIYASKKFTTASVTKDYYMFYECTELVGGKGTRFDYIHMDKEYARIDNSGPPGYFTTLTPTPSDVYAILYSDGTLTFQHGDTPEFGKTVTKTYEVDLDAAYAETSLEYSNRIPWYNERESINIVNFVDKISPTATAGWFFGCTNLERVDNIENLDTANVTNMNAMFISCSGLTTLDLSHFDTSNVTDVGYMFNWCSGLTALDLSHFDTTNVTYMSCMFMGCSNLKTIYACDKFTTASMRNSSYKVFSGCTSLVGGNGTKYDSEYIDNTYARIDGGASAPGYFTDKNTPTPEPEPEPTPSTDIYAVLYGDGELVFQNNNRTDSGRSVTDVYKVEEIYSWDEHSQSPTTPWYVQRDNITGVTFANKIRPDSTAYWFLDCEKLENIRNIENLDTSNVINMYTMFAGCVGLTNLKVSEFNTQNVKYMDAMFYGCSGLVSLDVSKFDTHNVTSMGQMFAGCSGLTSLSLTHFDTSNVTNMYDMFRGCSGLTELDVSSFNTHKVTNMGQMFTQCSELASLDVSGLDTSNVTNMSTMFAECSKLTALNLSGFNTRNVTDMSQMFYNCSGLTSLIVDSFDTSNVTNMKAMFYKCQKLDDLDVSEFNTSNVTNMAFIFAYCRSLRTIYAFDGFVPDSAVSDHMFESCYRLVGGEGTHYNNITYPSKEYARIDNGADAPGYFTLK